MTSFHASLKTSSQASVKGLTIMEDRPIVTSPSCEFANIDNIFLNITKN